MKEDLIAKYPSPMPVPTLRWEYDHLIIIDQRRLPEELQVMHLHTPEETAFAIKTLAVRGAPAIGAAAAYGVCLAEPDAKAYLAACTTVNVRPTAVNLSWALRRMKAVVEKNPSALPEKLRSLLIHEADFIAGEDRRRCRQMSLYGADLINDGMTVHTHCNAGALATVDFGTAVGVVFMAKAQGKQVKVIADETRPLLQGSRITAWECLQAGIPVTVICDDMAGLALRLGKSDIIIVGADRVAANGDFANKIGTYSLAILAKHHGIPFYTAAPASTIDITKPNGDSIPIEERDPDEIALGFGKRTAPLGADYWNPAFDVTPHDLLSGIITEAGVIYPPFEDKLLKVVREFGLPEP
jgi:methylthioribose-1-phosphate isomerase